MRLFIYFLIAMAGGIVGYSLGTHQGKEARKALAKVEAAAKEEKKSHDTTVHELEVQLKSLQTGYTNEMQKINAQFDLQQRNWKTELNQRDDKIEKLVTTRSKAQKENKRLQTSLASAGPEEKTRLLNRIKELDKNLEGLKIYITGLECSKTRVPQEYIEILKGEKL